MKKILLTLLTIILVALSATVFANEEIEGLNEKLDELLMVNCFTEEQIDEMDKKDKEEMTEYLLNKYIPNRQSANKMETDSVEEEFELLMDQLSLVYEDGLKVTPMKTFNYLFEYATSECFEYLFSDKEFWNVPTKAYRTGNNSAYFKMNGERLKNVEEYTGGHDGIMVCQDKTAYLIREKNVITELLREAGVKKVEDIKYCEYDGDERDSIFGLYFKCDNDEYFLAVYSSYWGASKWEDYNYFKFTTLEELAHNVEEGRPNSYRYLISSKPTFEAEAVSLQNEGLLYGNEKGLDLLKPLTRVEAATMLLRAMGEETVATEGQAQTFTDVLTSHWGFGAVENAYSLGLIKGMGDNLFAPEEPVTAVQFATMVLRAGNEPEFNWEEAIDILIEKGVITEENSKTMDFFTRGDMAKIIYEARNNGLF